MKLCRRTYLHSDFNWSGGWIGAYSQTENNQGSLSFWDGYYLSESWTEGQYRSEIESAYDRISESWATPAIWSSSWSRSPDDLRDSDAHEEEE